MIHRPFYLEWLNRWKDKDVIKVITGMRRCGKSTVMEMFQGKLKESGVSESAILAINFESFEEEYPQQSRELYRYIVERLASGQTTYVFLDEVQHVEEFEKAIDALYIREDVDLYITGSNAYFLSSELATLLTGRYVELQMFPFSFKEYVAAYREKESSQRKGGLDYPHDFSYDYASPIMPDTEILNQYLIYGGLPYATTLSQEKDIAEYLAGVFSTIIVKDIAARRSRMDLRAFEATASFLADNVGNISSIKRIAEGLGEQSAKVSAGAVSEYVDALMESYLLFKASRYDLKGREYLKTLEKYYVGDLGFRFWLLGKNAGDVGHRIENVVYLELLRRFDGVAIGKQGNKEIDFVCKDDGSLHYFQVAQTVLDEETLKRELGPLQSIEDNYPKTLLTLDTVGTGSYAGIQHVNLINWLLGE